MLLVHFVTDLASLLTDHKMSGRRIRAKYRHFKAMCEQTSGNSPTDSSSWIHNIPLFYRTSFWNSPLMHCSTFATTFVTLFCLLHGMVGATSLSSFFSHLDRQSIFLLFFEHYRASVFLLPIPVSLDSERLYQLRPNFWPYMIWSGSSLNLCPSPPGPHVSFGGFSFKRLNFVNPLQEFDTCLLEPTFQLSSIISLVTHPDQFE